MRQRAADRIDRGIAGVEPPPNPKPNRPATAIPFQAVKGKYRKPGTGCVTQINDHLWEGRYSPKVNGKRMARNIYAPTEAECEEKLAELILQMKAEIAALRSGASTEYPDGVSPKKKAVAAYLREHPGVSSKSLIARELQMDRSTVQRYYDEIRSEFQRQN